MQLQFTEPLQGQRPDERSLTDMFGDWVSMYGIQLPRGSFYLRYCPFRGSYERHLRTERSHTDQVGQYHLRVISQAYVRHTDRSAGHEVPTLDDLFQINRLSYRRSEDSDAWVQYMIEAQPHPHQAHRDYMRRMMQTDMLSDIRTHVKTNPVSADPQLPVPETKPKSKGCVEKEGSSFYNCFDAKKPKRSRK